MPKTEEVIRRDDDDKVIIVKTNSDDNGRNQMDIYLKDRTDSDDSHKGHIYISEDGDTGMRPLTPKD